MQIEHYVYRAGELGHPAAVEAEEAAVRAALRKAFRTLDDDILREARAEGARDGATALLVMRMGDMLYAAHAGAVWRWSVVIVVVFYIPCANTLTPTCHTLRRVRQTASIPCRLARQ